MMCMSDTKERLSVSIDSDLAEHARTAVTEGRASSVSAWVSAALRRQTEHDGRLRALGELIADYEAEHGEISHDEMQAASRRAAKRAVVVRGLP